MIDNVRYDTKPRQDQNIYFWVPENQNKCWYKIGSPPPAGSKKEVLKLRSANNIVIAPARTGRERNNKIEVKRILQTNKGKSLQAKTRILEIVEMKLIAPKILLKPATCNEKILKSTEA